MGRQTALQKMARLRGFRGVLVVPLMSDGRTIGVITVTRVEPGTFATTMSSCCRPSPIRR